MYDELLLHIRLQFRSTLMCHNCAIINLLVQVQVHVSGGVTHHITIFAEPCELSFLLYTRGNSFDSRQI